MTHKSDPYAARNVAAVTLAHLALETEGWDAYVATDAEASYCKDVLYVETPHGQMSYHIAPEDVMSGLLSGIPCKPDAQWDGKFNGQNLDFAMKHRSRK